MCIMYVGICMFFVCMCIGMYVYKCMFAHWTQYKLHEVLVMS
jgi:hypothetical protein